MTVFLIGAGLMLLLSVVWLLLPLLRRPPQMDDASVALSPALHILREQRAEAEAEYAAGRLDDAAFTQSMAELERRALEESTAPEQARKAGPARLWAVALGLSLPLASLALYLLLGNPAGLDPAQTLNQQMQIEQMVDKLAAKVAANPDDFEGAQMLARSYMVLGRHADAVKVLERLSLKQPKNAQLLADWADALASATDQRLEGEPEKLIQRALRLDPQNSKALALAGTLAFERKQYAKAAEIWERILPQTEPGSEFGQSVRAMVSEARQRAGMPPLAGAAAPAPELTLKLKLSLAEALRDKAAAGDTVFVFIRPAAGGPPLAGMRLTVADLPAEVDFAQATRMSQGPLPEQIIVGARVSKSGQPTAQSGDLQGLSDAFSPGLGQLKLSIDRQLP